MKGRTTLVMLLVLFGLLGYVWKFEKDKPSQLEVEAEARILLDLPPDRVDRVTIESDEGELELWRDSSHEWRMLRPVDDRADGNVVAALLQLLDPLESVRRVPGDRGSVVTYRLDRPDIVATFRIPRPNGYQTYELRVGRLNPAFNGHYAIVDQDTTRLGLLDRAFVESHLTRDPMDFRFRRITDFKAEEVERVVVQHRNEPRIVIERRFDGLWELREPVAALAEQAAVNQLTRRLASQRIASFVAESPVSFAAYDLENPRLTLTVVLENQASTALMLGRSAPDQGSVEGPEIYAKRAVVPKVFTIAGTSYEELAKTLFDLRDRRLFDLVLADVDSIEMTEGGRTFRAARRGRERWVDGRERLLRFVVIEQVVKNLGVLRGIGFDDRADADQLAGLGDPRLEISVYLSGGRVSTAVFNPAGDGTWWGRSLPDGSVARVNAGDLDAIRRFVDTPPLDG